MLLRGAHISSRTAEHGALHVCDDRPKGEVSESVLEEKSEQPAVEGESAEAATEEKEVDEEEIDDGAAQERSQGII